MLDRLRGAVGSEAALDGGEHHVADVRAGDPGTRNCGVGDDLAVEGVDDEGDADALAIPAADLQRIRAPADVRCHDRDLAVMDAAFPPAGGSLERQAVLAENAQHPFAIDRLQPKTAALSVQKGREATIAVGRALIDETADRRQQGAHLPL